MIYSREKALRLKNENHDCILLRRTRYFVQHKAKLWLLNSFCAHKRNCIYKREVGGKRGKKKVEFIDTHV